MTTQDCRARAHHRFVCPERRSRYGYELRRTFCLRKSCMSCSIPDLLCLSDSCSANGKSWARTACGRNWCMFGATSFPRKKSTTKFDGSCT